MKDKSRAGKKEENLINEIRDLLNDIGKKLNESKEEAIMNFEQEKNAFGGLLRQAQDRIDELQKENHSKAQELQAALDDLLAQLSLGRAETLDEFEDQNNQIVMRLHKFKSKAKIAFMNCSKELKVAWNRFAQELEAEEEKLDTSAKLHKLTYAEQAGKGEQVKSKKKELNERVKEFHEYIKENRSRSTTKIRNISDDLNNKLKEIKQRLAS